MKECWHCEGIDLFTERHEDGWLCVSCRSCHAKGPLSRSEQDAIEGWNTRPFETKLLARIGQYAKRCMEYAKRLSEVGK